MLPCSAKSKTTKFEMAIGAAQTDVKKALGKPSVVTKDSNNVKTWIYENVSKLPVANSDFGDVNTDARNTIIIIKFDDNDNVNQFSYHKSVY